MSFLTKEEKKEYNDAKKFARGELNKFILYAVIIAVVLAFVGGGVSLLYNSTITRQQINIDRENFEHSKSRVHGMIEDLAKYKLELSQTENETERQAIIQYITVNYATFNPDLIEQDSLRYFLYDVLEGRIK